MTHIVMTASAMRLLATRVAIGCLVTTAGTFAHATAYSDSFVADPASFGCGYYGTTEICGSYGSFIGPRTLAAGDTIDELVTYSSPVSIPGSKVFSGTYLYLPDTTAIGGLSRPGPYGLSGSTTVGLYMGSSSPITYYTQSGVTYTASGYLGGAYAGDNPGFSVVSSELVATVLTSDPNQINGLAYGYSVFLPATPALISGIAGGTPGHPAILPAGEVGQISFDISGAGAQSYYAFQWLGGLFQATGTVASPPPGESYTYQLEDLSESVLASITLGAAYPDSQTLTSCMTGTCDLSPGEYIIGVTDDGPSDPMFTIAFGTPVESTLGVPEPAAWALMLVGFGGLGAVIRRRRAGEIATALRADLRRGRDGRAPGLLLPHDGEDTNRRRMKYVDTIPSAAGQIDRQLRR